MTKNKAFGFLIIFVLSTSMVAQVVGPVDSKQPENLSARELFDEVNQFARIRFAELEGRGLALNDDVRSKTLDDQKRLAERYLGIARAREDNKGEDFYYIGMLGWISQDFPSAVEFLTKYVDFETENLDRRQVSRSVIVVILAREKEFTRAEAILEDYLEQKLEKPRERLRMESELGISKKASGDVAGSLSNTTNAFRAAVELLEDPRNALNAFVEIINMGMERFELCLALRNERCATAALEELREASFKADSPIAFFISTNELIRHHAERGRKKEAVALYRSSLDVDLKRFSNTASAADVAQRLRLNEKQFLLIGEPALELNRTNIAFPNAASRLSELGGKVILLDFWATWCLPCFEAFPKLIEWQNRFGDDLAILGVTRLYGNQAGREMNERTEIEYLRAFREEQKLNYQIVVGRDLADELSYGVRALPTVVLIDRKGKIRYIDSGSSNARFERLRLKLEELVSED